jgi:hypothetical protein
MVCVCITRLRRRYIYRERCSRGIKKEGRKPIERKRAKLKGTTSGQYAVFKGKRKKSGREEMIRIRELSNHSVDCISFFDKVVLSKKLSIRSGYTPGGLT